jgi:hypothetical protein
VDFADVLASVSFRFVRPERPLPAAAMWRLISKPRLWRLFERLNTRIETDDPRTRRLIDDLALMRRMSTLAVGYVLREAVARMPADRAFVNVGVWEGFTLFAGMAGNPDKICVGVDSFCQFDRPRASFLSSFERLKSPLHAFHEMDFAEYFSRRHRGPIGVYFYDAEHGYDNQLRALEMAEPHLAPGAIVIVDDMEYEQPLWATRDFLRHRPGMYETLARKRVARNGHPTWWNGIIVLRKRG